jgi:hypothetical protein
LSREKFLPRPFTYVVWRSSDKTAVGQEPCVTKEYPPIEHALHFLLITKYFLLKFGIQDLSYVETQFWELIDRILFYNFSFNPWLHTSLRSWLSHYYMTLSHCYIVALCHGHEDSTIAHLIFKILRLLGISMPKHLKKVFFEFKKMKSSILDIKK